MQSPSIFMSRVTWDRFILAPGTSVLSDFERPNPQKADFTSVAKIPTLKKPAVSLVQILPVWVAGAAGPRRR